MEKDIQKRFEFDMNKYVDGNEALAGPALCAVVYLHLGKFLSKCH